MNPQIRKVGIAVTVCFVALFVQLNYLQVVSADRYANHPRNIRAVLRDFAQPRGDIVTPDGTVVATSEKVDDEFERQRKYPTGDLFGHISGFLSFTLGATGVEEAYNDDLAGRRPDQAIENIGDWLIGKEPTGDVVLTITNAAQEAARAALGNVRGSIAALDPTTGAVLALWSNPSYDPTPLAAHSSSSVQEAFDAYNADPVKPMLARAYRERFPPGSTFKVVTAATAIEEGVATPETRFPSLRALDLPQSDRLLRNFGGSSCGGTLAVSFRRSCNTVFGQLGLDLGEKLADGAIRFGIGRDVPFDLNAARSQGPAPGTFDKNQPSFANAAIGQGDVAVTPLQMAMVAGAIGNGGVLMRPHVVAEVRDSDGGVARRIRPRVWRRAVSVPTAAAVGRMMVDVVQAGTGRGAAVPGVQVAGKTGTAQAPGGPPHAWFVAYAPADAPRVAVAVLVERGGDLGDEATGGRLAAPIAGTLLKQLLAGEVPPDSGQPAAGGGG